LQAVRHARDREYAELIVDGCLGVQPGWQVLVGGNPLAAPLLEEVCGAVARRGAHALLRISFDRPLVQSYRWVSEAPLELVAEPAPLLAHELETADALLFVSAPENTRAGASVEAERLQLVLSAYQGSMARVMSHEIAWVACQYPTHALAQEAGIGTEEFADLLYGSVLRDWADEGERMQRIAGRFDAASEVRIVGAETDLRLSLEGRTMKVDALGSNLPGGEFFGCPLENSAEGEISFAEFPAVYNGREVSGIRLRFDGGRVVDASATANEEFLLQMLDTDEGARRLGELGIGCNPGIERFTKNVGFDEKIDGTVHLAIGNSYASNGGQNVSSVHWDMVKDLRGGGRIYADGTLVQEDGSWL
jgi:aminopeptidase